jgi:nucleoside-diphosphate-sugar epimerase
MVLITGWNGFLGNYLMKEFPKRIVTVGRSNFSDVYSDLSKEVPVLPWAELVIHAAGKAHSVPKTESEKNEFHNVNVIGTANLLKGLEKAGVPKQFLFISSVSVYGQVIGKGIKEEHQLQAKDSYGLSKIEAEKLVAKWCSQNNVVCTILRLPLLVGENPPGNLGTMLRAIEKGYYFNIGGGKARKSMVLAQDVAAFIPKVAAIGGIYNLTDGVHPDFQALSSAISKQKCKKMSFNLPFFIANIIGYFGDLLGNKAPINSLKVKKITSDLTFDDAKARESLGWKPQGVLEYLKNNRI